MSGLDVVVAGGLVFDGSGAPPRVADVGIRGATVVAVSEAALPVGEGTRSIDARGRWVTPGFVDLHTHYDAEVELAPALLESLRHGVTSIVLGSCSLGMAVGRPIELADMFCRVEGIPRAVVAPLFERIKTWDSPSEYLDHLDGLALGPNVSCLLGHSTIRAAAMGMERALDRRAVPHRDEWTQMERWLDEALDAGYLGLSISTLPWDKMDGEEFRSRPMPSVFARWSEYRRLAKSVRRRGRVLQAVPNISTKVNFPLFLMLSAGLGRRPLKTTLISLMDIRADRLAFRIAGALARLANRWLRADFRMQALPNPFDLWADGVDLVVFEEFAAGAAALHLQTELERRELFASPEYRERFHRQWRDRLLPRAFHRDLGLAVVRACPDATLVGHTFVEIARDRGVDPIDAFLDLVAEHGKALRWYTVMGNDRPDALEWIVRHPDILVGFSDAGAHYNFPLRLLRLVAESHRVGKPCMPIERAVHRLTAEIADWLGIDAGALATGRRADVVVLDPAGLDGTLEDFHEAEMPEFGGLRRLVRRNDRAVDSVLVAGRIAVTSGRPVPELGHARGFGRVLRAAC
jgi:N-acyl-D-aspartate/D-glutamate deacylase